MWHYVNLFGRIHTLSTLVMQRCFPSSYMYYTSAIPRNVIYQSTLDLSSSKFFGSLSMLLHSYFQRLSVLILRDCDLGLEDLNSLSWASSRGRLPHLRLLDLTGNTRFRYCDKIICQPLLEAACGFPSLTHLILARCGLKPIDLCCLVQARIDGKLPRIRYLDISLNGLSDHVGILTRDPLTHREITWEKVVC